jgi:hypothetical protein
MKGESMRAITVATLLLLGACQSAYLPDGRPNENSTLFEVTAGARLVIQRDLVVPPYHYALFLQDGKVHDFSGINKYDTYCAFSVDGASDPRKTIASGSYVVDEVHQQLMFQVAQARSGFVKTGQRNDGHDDWRVMATVMRLSSAQTSMALKAVCATWGLPQDMHKLTVAGIRRSLGDVVRLELAEVARPK